DDMLIALIHLCLLIRPHALVRHFLRRALLDMCSPCKRGLFWPIQGLMKRGMCVVCVCVCVCACVCVCCVCAGVYPWTNIPRFSCGMQIGRASCSERVYICVD